MAGYQWKKELKVQKGQPRKYKGRFSEAGKGKMDSKTRKSLKSQGCSAGKELTNLLSGLLITDLK